MYQVTGEYTDYKKFNRKSYFYLNADKRFNPYTWRAPINWEGIVGGINVKFTQIDNSAYSENCFNWTEFPDELSIAKSDIVEAIDKAMRIMD